MSKVGATTRASSKPLKRRISGASMSALAVLLTIWPLVISGLWVYNTFLHEPRGVVALSALQQPENVRLFDEPLVSVTFDDGWESIYKEGAPILQKHGIPTTQYVLSGFFDDPQYMSKQQVLSLQSAGHDIQSHTISHEDLRALDDEDLELELGQSKEDLSKLVGHDVTAFASPMSSYDGRVKNRVQAYYYSHRASSADIATLSRDDVNEAGTFDPYTINAFAVRSTTKLSEIKAFLAYAKQRKAWVVLVYHEVGTHSKSVFNVTPKQLDEQLSVVKQSGIKIATVTQVMDDYNSRLQRPQEYHNAIP
jgi:peptidoglycan/xylan/chitin deacetylase (PgdA/CDA1 family)